MAVFFRPRPFRHITTLHSAVSYGYDHRIPMSRVPRLILALTLLAPASFARADALRLLAPAPGATLRGGSFVELRRPVTALQPSAEEWEAFLSVDGGKYYAFRITPHLDIALQRFTFVVPNVDTRDARILIRTGNEVVETHFETEGSFSIVRDAAAEQGLPSLLQFGRGEAARDGDPAVLGWAEGERDGSDVAQQSSTAIPVSSLRRITTDACESPSFPPPAGISIPTPSHTILRGSAGGVHGRPVDAAPLSVDLLLMCRRRNI
jgi:hypothetical protein